MNKRFWMAFAACYVIGQLLGFMINGVLLAPSYQAQAAVWRPEADLQAHMWVFLLTSLVAIFLFCFIFTKGYENKGVMEGVRYGAIVGVFVTVPMAFDSWVVYPLPVTLAVKWLLTGVPYWIVLGAVLAAIYRKDAAAG